MKLSLAQINAMPLDVFSILWFTNLLDKVFMFDIPEGEALNDLAFGIFFTNSIAELQQSFEDVDLKFLNQVFVPYFRAHYSHSFGFFGFRIRTNLPLAQKQMVYDNFRSQLLDLINSFLQGVVISKPRYEKYMK